MTINKLFVFTVLSITIYSGCILSDSSCNLTIYNNWLNIKYVGILSTDSKFWRYQTQTEMVLTNNLALQLAVASCQNGFDRLKVFRAGRNGPATIQDSYRIMCNSYCLESDIIHQEAMEKSQCSCLELSTQPTDSSYHFEGDWCVHNSARILCSTMDYCGIWNCRIDDFMCPRYEWNKKFIPLKAHGSCIRGASSKSGFSIQTLTLSIIFTFIVILMNSFF